MNVRIVLLVALAVLSLVFVAVWLGTLRKRGVSFPGWLQLTIGFITDFFDTLGIGSFAPTTALLKFWRLAPDETIPGTLNVGHALPTVLEAFVFIAIVQVDPLTLISMIIAAIAGAYLGAGIVASWPRIYVQVGMGAALLVAAVLFMMTNLHLIPGGGSALGLTGGLLAAGVIANFALGALMTLGIGLYGPCLILVSLLGMSPLAAFPIMMGSCAFLMPVASLRFIRFYRYDVRAALGLAIGGLPGVLLAAFVVKSLPLTYVRWLVVVVVLYAAVVMLRSALAEKRVAAQPA